MLARTSDPKKRAEREAELDMPPFPDELGYLWVWFCRLRRRKGSTGFGPAPIEFTDIRDFIMVNKITLDGWEVGLIEELDDILLAMTGGNVTSKSAVAPS